MSALPPPRYRVIERDRRLVVIDEWADHGRPESATPVDDGADHGPNDRIAQSGPAPERQGMANNPFGSVRRTGYDGRAELRTHPLYDAKGPRTIRLDPGSRTLLSRIGLGAIGFAFAVVILAIVNFWLLLPILFVAVQGRARLRDGITAWLDMVQLKGS